MSELSPPPNAELPLATRIWFAWVCFYRILLDAVFARRVWDVYRETLAGTPALPPKSPEPAAPIAPLAPPSNAPALQLLALLQREGRFIDFLEEDVAAFPDADVGAAARVVHEGCRKAIREHAKLTPVRTEAEGARVTVEKGTPPTLVKLVGNVTGEAPFHCVLRHKGWRVGSLSLPTAIDGHDVHVIAPAEVEL